MATTYSDLFAIYKAVLKGTTDLPIDGLSSHAVSPGADRIHYRGASRVYPTVSTLAVAKRAAEFSTINLNALLGLSNILKLPMPIGTSETYTSVEIWEANHSDLGVLASSGARKNAVARGLLIVNSIRASQSSDGRITPATADVSILPVGDGTNDPLAVSIGQTLPAAGSENLYYAMGGVYVNGTEEKLATGWSLNLGFNIDTVFEAGGLYPRTAHLKSQMPTLSINLRSPKPLSDYGPSGSAIGTTIVLWLVKCDATGARISGTTAAHLKITINHGTITPGDTSGSLGSDVTNSLLIQCLDDGTNDIVIAEVDQQLP